ncbi:hypothetical protein OG894_42310 (plasmid) [Streptomyces sp. NBC_01724]|uniref:hypothetical protein n=1 Tax=Streptomyces sp. NBC_01724 TaxID=2975922 RepID=UPI002E35C131|nr:hypothetical protein [Streptomyces sp. NBC_01724]
MKLDAETKTFIGQRFLLWLCDLKADGADWVPVRLFFQAHGIREKDMWKITQAVADKLVEHHVGAGGYGSYQVRLTDCGVKEAKGLRRAVLSSPVRTKYTWDALLKWTFKSRSGIPLDANAFLGTQESCCFGEPMDRNDLDEALVYLRDEGLIETDGHVVLRITRDGFNCVMGDVKVSDYVNRRGGGHMYSTNFHGPVQGAQVGGEGNTQNNAFTLDASELRKFAAQVRELAPQLNLDETVEAELVDEVDELEEAASEASPEAGKLRRLFNRVMQLLGSAPDSVIAQLLLTGGQQAITGVLGR